MGDDGGWEGLETKVWYANIVPHLYLLSITYILGCFRDWMVRELAISEQSWFEVRGFEPHLRLYLGTI